MIRLTRLNQEPVAVNPDNILWVDAGANTVLCFVGGDKLMVRESLEELIARVLGHHQRIQHGAATGQFADAGHRPGGDAAGVRVDSGSATGPTGWSSGSAPGSSG